MHIFTSRARIIEKRARSDPMSQLWLHKLPPAPPRSPFSNHSARHTDPSSLSVTTPGSSSAPTAPPVSVQSVYSHCKGGGHSSGSGSSSSNSVGSTTQDGADRIEARLSLIEGQLGKILEELQELKQAHAKSNFLIKGSPSEVVRISLKTLF